MYQTWNGENYHSTHGRPRQQRPERDEKKKAPPEECFSMIGIA
jgi:hypothetical protein